MEDLEVYILTHKKLNYGFNLEPYQLLQCGAALTGYDVCELKDNTGDNISEKNELFLETTGIYWIWKNTQSKYVGQMQYRRMLSINPNLIPTVLNAFDIIISSPARLDGGNILEQYKWAHDENDLLSLKPIIEKLYPDYAETFDKMLAYNMIVYSNSFITTRERYNDICKFCFDILFEFEKVNKFYDKNKLFDHALKISKEKDATFYETQLSAPYHVELSPIAYESRICGYLFERLFVLYLLHNQLKYYACGDYLQFY